MKKARVAKPADLGKIEESIALELKKLEELPPKSKKYDAVKKSGWPSRIKDRFAPQRTYVMHFELRNGMHTSFTVTTKENSFDYMGGTYIIDPECMYFDISSKAWNLDYHQDLSLPIKREIPVKQLKTAISELGKIDQDMVVAAMNPSSVKEFIISKVIEQMLKAQDIGEFFKQMRVIFILILVTVIIHFLLFMKASGMLSNLSLPF